MVTVFIVKTVYFIFAVWCQFHNSKSNTSAKGGNVLWLLKIKDPKMKDQITRSENAGHRNAGPIMKGRKMQALLVPHFLVMH